MNNNKNDEWILKILWLALFGKNETNKGNESNE
jgi:hypothetical protein